MLEAVFFTADQTNAGCNSCSLPVSPQQAGARYPIAESVMDCPATQAYVHDCLVKVVEGRQVHRFRVYFKRHRYLPTSRSLAPFRGDVVVMRAGVIHPLSVVNMRGRDVTVSDFMISK